MESNEVSNVGLVVKAFVDWKPVETPVDSMEEAVKLFEGYTNTFGCDSAYIYQGERIVQSWAEEYGRWLDSQNEDDCEDDDEGWVE